jgi:putative lipoic acid-binding regulatory protein
MIDLSDKKLELDYPCDWQYKVVGHNQELIECAMKKIFDKREYKLKLSNVSSKGKFKSFSLNLLVHNEDDRVEIYNQLKDHDDIKYVL